jgi:hypothetical protein
LIYVKAFTLLSLHGPAAIFTAPAGIRGGRDPAQRASLALTSKQSKHYGGDRGT